MIRVWGVALALLVVVGCSSATPTTAPTPRGSSLIAGANVHCGAFEDRQDLCHDMAATAIQAVAIHSVEVRDVWLRPVPLCYFDIVCLFDPNAPVPAETPPLGGEWVGSAEISFDDVVEHAGVNLARMGDRLVVKQIGYGLPPPTWCSGGCPTAIPTTSQVPATPSLTASISSGAPHIACAEIADQLCDDMAAAAVEAVAARSLPVSDVWLSSGMLCFVAPDCLFDPNANFPMDTPPEGGRWVGSAEVAFVGTDEHAGISLGQVGDRTVSKLLGYRVPPLAWCSGGCPTVDADDGRFRLNFVMPRAVWHTNDPISGLAILINLGQADITIGASGQGWAFFAFDKADGSAHISYPISADCVDYVIEPATPLNQDLRMSVEGPADAHLTPGDWTITATAAFNDAGSCIGSQHTIKASLPVTVLD